jgi:hypothetical protein
MTQIFWFTAILVLSLGTSVGPPERGSALKVLED